MLLLYTIEGNDCLRETQTDRSQEDYYASAEKIPFVILDHPHLSKGRNLIGNRDERR